MNIGPLRSKPLPVVWITGQSGAGKTTLARALSSIFDAIILDGDEMRSCISRDLGMDTAGRHKNNIRIAELAHILSYQKIVIVAVIAPFEATRKEIQSICGPIWVYLHKGDISVLPDKPYEIPSDPNLSIDTSTTTKEESAKIVSSFLKYITAIW